MKDRKTLCSLMFFYCVSIIPVQYEINHIEVNILEELEILKESEIINLLTDVSRAISFLSTNSYRPSKLQ